MSLEIRNVYFLKKKCLRENRNKLHYRAFSIDANIESMISTRRPIDHFVCELMVESRSRCKTVQSTPVVHWKQQK